MWWWFVFLTPEAPILYQKILFWLVIGVAIVTVIAIIVQIIHNKNRKRMTDELFGRKDEEGK